MFPPCEMMVKSFLPSTRGLLIHKLRRNGYSQPAIAKLLGITQAAVSQSLSKGENTYKSNLVKMGIKPDEITTLVNLLAEDILHSPERTNETLYTFWNSLLSEGRLCDYHRRMYPQLANCEICLVPQNEYLRDERRIEIIKKLEECVRKIEKSPFFKTVMPEVSINIVYSTKNPKTIYDVAAIPGRIVKVGDYVKAVGRPVFGASQHMANVLLAVNSLDNRIRAAINVRNDDYVKNIITKLGLPYIVAEDDKGLINEEMIIQAIVKAYDKLRVVPCVVFHEGGIGYEPATYIFGENPMQVTEIAEKIAKNYIATKR